MRLYLFSISFIFIALSSYAQETTYYKFLVVFKDKANSPYSITQPDQFLSQKAIERRAKSKIAIDESDLPVNPSYIQSVRALGFDFLNKSNWSNFITVGTTDSSKITILASLQFVSKIECIYKGKVASPKLVPLFSSADTKSLNVGSSIQDFSNLTYGNSATQIEMIGVDYMHKKGYYGNDIVIAVFDAGFYKVDELPAFEHIRSNNNILGTWDFVLNESSVYEDNTHGMSVLSCIAGYVQDKLVGTAPNAKFYLLRTEDAATETLTEEYNWEAAAVWADSAGVDIINSSLGYTTFDNPAQNHTYQQLDGNTAVITRAADKAASKGIFVVNSAGNSGASTWYYIGAPADGDSVLAVGAVKADRKIANFSSRGPAVDGRVKPNVCAMGSSTVVSLSSGEIGVSNGTSFSSPVIAGAVATLWQANPSATNMELFDAIIRSADRFDNPNGDYGYGIPNLGYADLLLKYADASSFYEKQDLQVYPNPNQGILHVDFFSFNDSTYNFEVSDLKGRIILSQKRSFLAKSVNNVQVQLPDTMAAGTYVLAVKDGKKVFSTKFIIQK